MTGRCCRSIPVYTERNQYVLSIAQKEKKMNIDEIINDLKAQMQTLEDMKTQLTEGQENIRESLCQLQMVKEGEK